VTKWRIFRAAIAGPILFGAISASAPAPAPMPMALDILEKGAWDLTPRQPGEAGIKLCLGDPRQMVQVQHLRQRCTFHVIEDRPNHTTVHYSCPGAGHGRTTLRIETSRLAQIHTQGIAEAAPFVLAYEARRKGACR
jgi:hypothetical protein